MRAGKLDRDITIQRGTTTIDEYGTMTQTWADVATLRAQIVQQSTEEFIRGFGASDVTAVIFRTRWLDGVTNADRISHDGGIYNIKEMKEIGRRRGLEIRCTSMGGDQ
ncbi:MAG: phage head closure protein [Hyphomicrobiaceae bacterium]|nr:phage head closure protein [Hyphomicrobiaceae bacterium]